MLFQDGSPNGAPLSNLGRGSQRRRPKVRLGTTQRLAPEARRPRRASPGARHDARSARGSESPDAATDGGGQARALGREAAVPLSVDSLLGAGQSPASHRRGGG